MEKQILDFFSKNLKYIIDKKQFEFKDMLKIFDTISFELSYPSYLLEPVISKINIQLLKAELQLLLRGALGNHERNPDERRI